MSLFIAHHGQNIFVANAHTHYLFRIDVASAAGAASSFVVLCFYYLVLFVALVVVVVTVKFLTLTLFWSQQWMNLRNLYEVGFVHFGCVVIVNDFKRIFQSKVDVVAVAV